MSGGGAGETLYTPSLDLGILAGVTRAALLEASAYDVGEGAYPLDELLGADEVFTSSSVREVMPVVSVDGHAFERGPAAAAAPGRAPGAGVVRQLMFLA